jgi:hypothetical protein
VEFSGHDLRLVVLREPPMKFRVLLEDRPDGCLELSVALDLLLNTQANELLDGHALLHRRSLGQRSEIVGEFDLDSSAHGSSLLHLQVG